MNKAVSCSSTNRLSPKAYVWVLKLILWRVSQYSNEAALTWWRQSDSAAKRRHRQRHHHCHYSPLLINHLSPYWSGCVHGRKWVFDKKLSKQAQRVAMEKRSCMEVYNGINYRWEVLGPQGRKLITTSASCVYLANNNRKCVLKIPTKSKLLLHKVNKNNIFSI